MNDKSKQSQLEILRQKYWGITNGVISLKTKQVFAKVYSSKGTYYA